jgi:hypothetical protein
MDRLTQYRQAIRQLLSDQISGYQDQAELNVECQIIADTENDHYQLLDIGWEDLKRVYNCFVHIDIKDGKIWIQRNMTETDLGKALVEMGIPKEDIVLGLHPAYERPLTGYGVA